MSPDQGFEERQRERKVRGRNFRLVFAIFALVLGGFLIRKLSSLILPIIVGGLLAFLFRPVKERFKIGISGLGARRPVILNWIVALGSGAALLIPPINACSSRHRA